MQQVRVITPSFNVTTRTAQPLGWYWYWIFDWYHKDAYCVSNKRNNDILKYSAEWADDISQLENGYQSISNIKAQFSETKRTVTPKTSQKHQ